MSFHDRDFGRKNAGARVDDAVEFTEVMDALKARDAEIKSFAEKADAEIKATGKIASETKSALEKLSADGAGLAERMQAVEQKMARRSVGPDRKSLGEQFTDSQEFKSFSGSGSVRLSIKANELTSATTDTNGAVGDAIVPHRLPGVLMPAERMLTIRDLLLPGRTSSNAVEFVQETGFTNSAATRAELGSTAQSHLKFDLKTTNVVNIAHHVIASRNILSDVPMLQSYIDTRLRYGLKDVEEAQLLAGDGQGTNLKGLLEYAVPFNESGLSVANDTFIDTVRRAVLQVRVAELRPTFITLNPIDWAAIELTKDKEDRYIEVSIRDGSGAMRLWRLNVIETTAISQGEFLVGATMGAQIFDREDAAVEVATQHADFRLNGKVAIIAEERLALAVTRPEAFVYGQFDLDSSPSING